VLPSVAARLATQEVVSSVVVGTRGPVALHASRLTSGDDAIAVVIDRCRPLELTPSIMEAYDLMPRESEVTQFVLRGSTTAQIARTSGATRRPRWRSRRRTSGSRCPNQAVLEGLATIAPLMQRALSDGEWRLVATRANRMPTAASYLRRPGDSEFCAFKFDVLRVVDGTIAEIATFGAGMFPAFGLPPVLASES
jgi:hypothetical protein